MYPSLFKPLCCTSYWLWVIYPVGKHALILKGTAFYSAILAAAVKVLCSYCRVYFICTVYRTMQYLSVVMLFYYLGCKPKLITLHLIYLCKKKLVANFALLKGMLLAPYF